MHKLVVVLRGAAESEWMERRWSEDFVPLAERMPGLRRVLVGRVRGAAAGPVFPLISPDQVFPSPLDDRPAGPGSWWRVWRWGRWRRSTSECAPAPGASCDFGSISRIPPFTPAGRSSPATAAGRRPCLLPPKE